MVVTLTPQQKGNWKTGNLEGSVEWDQNGSLETVGAGLRMVIHQPDGTADLRKLIRIHKHEHTYRLTCRLILLHTRHKIRQVPMATHMK